jgi:hypothetical protein
LIQHVFTMSSSYKRYISKICLTVSSFENHTTFSITVSMPCNSRFRSWARLYVRLYHKRIFIFCDTLSLCHWDGTLYLYVRVWFCNRCQKRGRRSSTKPGRRSGCERWATRGEDWDDPIVWWCLASYGNCMRRFRCKIWPLADAGKGIESCAKISRWRLGLLW